MAWFSSLLLFYISIGLQYTAFCDYKLYWSQKLTRLYPLRLLNLHKFGIVSKIAEPCKENHNPKSAMSDDVCARMCKRFWGSNVYVTMWESVSLSTAYTPQSLGWYNPFYKGCPITVGSETVCFRTKGPR